MTKSISLVRQTAYGWYREDIQSEKWDAKDNQSKHTPISAGVFEKVAAAFRVYGENAPRILFIDFVDDDDYFSCAIKIELPGGVIMEVGPVFTVSPMRIPEILAKASDEAAELVSEFVGYCAHLGFEELTNKIDDARSGLNKIFEQWSNDGDAHIELVDLRMRADVYSQYNYVTPVQVTISCLGESLFPEKLFTYVWDPDDVVTEGMKLHAEMKARTQTKARLKKHRADGIIDLIAMNSLLLDGRIKAKPESYLGKLREPGLHPDYKVKCGRLYLEATDSYSPSISWYDGYMKIYDREIPSTICDVLRGQPITNLIEHPLLTSGIIIQEIFKENDGKDYFKVKFEQPCFYYCHKTGRFWPV